MSNISALNNIPEISFINNDTLESTKEDLLLDYITQYEKLTGNATELSESDPIRLILYAVAQQVYQSKQYIDRAGKQNLLKYSYSEYLDNLGALKGITRNAAVAAKVTLRYTLSDARTSATGIPAGSRVCNIANVYFATDEYVEIPIGSLYVDVTATAIKAGTAANGIASGTITTMVDVISYIESVTNITVSAGGTEIETDDELTERIYMAPTGYSVAGPLAAYIYWAKQFRSDVADVMAYSPEASCVTLLFMLSDGVMPSSEVVSEMWNYLNDSNIKPLTDNLTVTVPDEVIYTIDLTYYIRESDTSQAAAIQTAVNEAIEYYKIWQRKIGRDINPSELIKAIITAGAKRVALTTPNYVSLDNTEIAALGTANIIYGGIEDD